MKLMRLALVVLFILATVPAVADSRAEGPQMPEISDYQKAAHSRLILPVAIQEDELVKIRRRMETLRRCIGLLADRLHDVLVLVADDPTVSPKIRSAASEAIETCLYVLSVLGLF